MWKTREEYERLINESPLFDMNREDNPSAYDRERNRLLTNLAYFYKYYICVRIPQESYEYSLVVAADDCVKRYDSRKGEFLNFFGVVFKKKYNHDKYHNKMDVKRGGLTFSRKEERQIKEITRYARSKKLELSDATVQEEIAKLIGESRETVAWLIQADRNAVIADNEVYADAEDGDDGEISLLDRIPDESADIEGYLDQIDLIGVVPDDIEYMDELFQDQQERMQPMLSMLLTAAVITYCESDLIETESLLEEISFRNEEEIEFCRANGRVHTQKEIGECFDVLEQSVSRTYRIFRDKLKALLNKKDRERNPEE